MRVTVTILLALFTTTLIGCSTETSDTADTEGTTATSESPTLGAESQSLESTPAPGDSFALSGDNTQVLFTGTKKSGDNHSGGFKTMEGTIGLTDAGGVASISIVIQTESLFSDAERLTGHLKNEDFFSVNEFPEMKFESSSVDGEGDITVKGELTMHGKSAEISFPATAKKVDDGIELTAEFKVDRTRFGMDYVGKPDDPINADVDIKVIVGQPAPQNAPALLPPE